MNLDEIMAVKEYAKKEFERSEMILQMAVELEQLQKEKFETISFVGGKKIRLRDLPDGSLFAYAGTIALKSEYRSNDDRCLCYIYGTGETFAGGAKSASEHNNLLVTPWVFKSQLS